MWSKSLRFLFPHGAVKGPFSCRQFLVSLGQKAWRGAQSPGCNQYCSRKLAALLHIIGRLQSSQPRPSVCVFSNSRSVLNTTLNWCPLGRAVWELGCQGDQWRRLVLGCTGPFHQSMRTGAVPHDVPELPHSGAMCFCF